MYVYKRTEPRLWTVGFYAPDGTWEPESDHASTESAAGRVHWLNGGSPAEGPPPRRRPVRRQPYRPAENGEDARPPTIEVVGEDPDRYTVRLIRQCPEGHSRDCPHTEIVASREDVVAASFLAGTYDRPDQIDSEAMRGVVAEMLAELANR